MRKLLPAVAILTLAPLSACKREPTFDERYVSTEKTVRAKARELDRDMTKRNAEAQATASTPANEAHTGAPSGAT